jgi:hypothetical protein
MDGTIWAYRLHRLSILTGSKLFAYLIGWQNHNHESGLGGRAPAALALAVIHFVSPILTLQYPRTIFEPQGIILLSLYFYLNNATSP